jgi:hypothetical protein
MDVKFKYIILGMAFTGSALIKMVNITTGGPHVTIDDSTFYEGGFLVWFGNAPPQRMYLESWIAGITCVGTYLGKILLFGEGFTGFNINLITDAYRDYYNAPDHYVHIYRLFVLLIDLLTAWMVYQVARIILKDRWQGFAAIAVSVMYLFSYNTVWCNLVARPDNYVAFFGMIGLFYYYRSSFGEQVPRFWISAVAFGLSAGMKLHGAFFIIFVLFDLLRYHGLFKGLRKAGPFVLISIIFFALSSGTPLFDPLKYVKLRMLNYSDDVSPWINWGDQFIQILRGSGWFSIPLLLGAIWKSFISKNDIVDKNVKSLIFQAACWLMVFSLIRQLRAYWMLPVLPLFYMAAVFALGEIRQKRLTGAIILSGLALLFYQSYQEAKTFQVMDFNGLRRWVSQNVKQDEPFYLFGYEALNLPKNTQCIKNITKGIETIINKDLQRDLPFTLRHLKNWEEHSELMLFEMLNFRNENGYTYYGYYAAPLDRFEGIIRLDQMRYVFIQQHFDMHREFGLVEYIERKFTLVSEQNGPGGVGKGLKYRIYQRKEL